jgi:hypothetical protein
MIYDLEEAELCYPPFGSAKDPVNLAGMVAGDVLRGDIPISHWDAHVHLVDDHQRVRRFQRGDQGGVVHAPYGA